MSTAALEAEVLRCSVAHGRQDGDTTVLQLYLAALPELGHVTILAEARGGSRKPTGA